jgi:3(or 17)beta-hydroxysteroid dehydrogenase
MTKGGVRLFTKAVALECADLGYNIRVNSIHPGVIDTDMGAVAIQNRGKGLNDPAQARAMVAKQHPIGRLGTAEDIANGALFLASEASSFMTGAELVLDGGITAR